MKNEIDSLLKVLGQFLLRPFGKGLSFFISILIISSLVEIVYSCIYDKIYIAIYLGIHHFIICYFLTLVSGLCLAKFRQFYNATVYFLLLINLLIDLVCSVVYHHRFCLDYADIMMGTNVNEVIEAFQTYFSLQILIYLILLTSFIIFIIKFIRKFTPQISLKLQIFLLGFVACNIFFISFGNHKTHWDIVSLGKLKAFMAIPRVDLREYKVTPNLEFVSQSTPKNVVLIIGESFTKSHSSLYGYGKVTNPCLTELCEEGKLYIFNNVTTSGLHTIEAFKNIMSTYTPTVEDKQWYECQTIPAIMEKMQYRTEWVSNQSQKGFYDNVITKYAELCDTMIFAGNKYAGLAKSEKDGVLLEIIQERIIKNSKNDKCFYVVHMMGSHADFKIRYPQEYNQFHVDEYTDHIVSQRKMLAEYDNSVLYNDYVVANIMKLFKDEESLVFYFPDHGIDLYESNDKYVGHAIEGNMKSCEVAANIPFVVYTSSLYQRRFYMENERVKASINKKFCTENLIYSIMDILGVNFQDNNIVKKYSLFN